MNHSARAWAGGLLGLLTLLAGGWLVLVRGHADALARPAPQRAIVAHPGHPVALGLLAEAALREGDIELAQQLAQRALLRGFHDGRSMRVLGAVAEQRGDAGQARRLMQAAARARPRDTATQYWLALDAISQQDLAVALRHLDRVLLFEPAAMRELFPLLGTFAANPVAVRELLPYLARPAPWRDAFLEQLQRQADDLGVVVRIARLLQASSQPFTMQERAQLVAALTARREWRLLATLQESAEVASLRDGSFEGHADGLLGGWQLPPVKGADARIVRGGDGAELQVYFHDRRVDFQHVRQLLLLPPGNWRLSGRARLAGLEGPQGLVWRLRCESSNGPIIGETALFIGERDWHAWRTDMQVPAQDCGGQWLQLEIPARIAAEQRLKGLAAFDDLRLEALPAASSASSGAAIAAGDEP